LQFEVDITITLYFRVRVFGLGDFPTDVHPSGLHRVAATDQHHR
jgi:hypothetical protein